MVDRLIRQREFFEILNDFFKNATGDRPEDFAELDKFGDAVHQKGKQFARERLKLSKKALRT